jgi:enoyl-CoA hydratase
MTYDEPNVKVTTTGGVALMLLARPPVNAFDRSMYDQMRRAIHRIADDRSVRVVVLTGEGRVFCGGNELSEFVDFSFETANEHLAHVRLCLNAVYDCPVPIIGAINGAAIGTGCSLASLCDIRISAQSAVYALPEIDVGVLGGARHILRTVPQGLLRLMMYTGRRITASQALAASMVDEVVPDAEVVPKATALAEEIASKNPEAIRMAKQVFNRVEDMTLKEGYEYECTRTAALRKFEGVGQAAERELANRSRSREK